MIDIPIGRTPTGKRSFTMAYKFEVLRLWDQCLDRGAKARLMRENNLDSSTVHAWVRARDRGDFTTTMVKAADKSRMRMDSRDRAELAKLRKENERLRQKVVQAETAQEILGKAFELVQGITTSSTEDTEIPPALMSADEYAAWLDRKSLS